MPDPNQNVAPSPDQSTNGGNNQPPNPAYGKDKDAGTKPASADQKPPDDSKAGDKTGDQGKTVEGDKPPVVPEKYELKLPDDSPLDPVRVEKIAAFAKEHKLSQEAATAILQSEHEAAASVIEGQKKQHKVEAAAWLEQTMADPEVGGEKGKEKIELASRVVTRFGSPELIQTLDTTGLGNHKELVRMLYRIGSAMREDQLVLPKSAGGAEADVDFFPKSAPKK